MANYKRLSKIGVGSYGTVYKATLNKKPVAVKELHETLLHENIIDKFREECEILQRLHHKNVVRLIQFNISHSSSTPPALITELLDCDLEKYIKGQSAKIPFHDLVSMMLDVAEGLRYLHYDCSPAIIHRDLASKNILLTKARQAKIADLGLAKCFPRDSQSIYASPVPGTQVYAAPETFPVNMTATVEYNEKIDIFSFGVLLMETINGKYPECDRNCFDAAGRRIPEYVRREDDIQQMGDHILKRLVLRCIKDKSEERLNANDVVDLIKKAKIAIEKIASHEPPTLKIVTLGKSSAGKTCIIKRFADNVYQENARATTGLDSFSRNISVYDTEIRLTVYDTAGQERFSSIAPAYLRGADGVLLVFDITNKSSFEVSVPIMVELIQKHCDMSDIGMILVGNKVDTKDRRTVSCKRAEEYAENLGISYIETSAKTGQNIEEVFEKLTKLTYVKAELHLANQTVNEFVSSITLRDFQKEPTKKRCRPC